MDGGKISGESLLFILIWQSLILEKPFLFQIIQIKGESESFQNLGKSLTQYFKQHGMILACYVTDGCLAQVGGLSLNSAKSFQSLIESGFILPYHSPCACHLNQNAFKHAIIQLMFLNIYVDTIKETSIFLRKNDIKKIIGARYLMPIETRWMIYAIIAIWILDLGNEKISTLGKQFFDSVKDLHLFAMSLEPQRILISFYESDFALAADVLIMSYQTLQYLNDLILNNKEFQSGDWRKVVECLGENLLQSICKGNNGAHYTLACSLTPAGALSLSKGNLLFGLDLPSCLDRDQIPQLLHFCQTSDMFYNKKQQFVEGLAATDLSEYDENEDEDDEEEQKQQQDDSGEYKPYRNMAFEEQKDNRITKMKTRSQVSDLINVQNFAQEHVQPERQIALKAQKDLQNIDWHETCNNEAKLKSKQIAQILNNQIKVP
ncbi:MAG: hypothetical protein EZS28_041286 [Streblomastix strix]|uniref:Uncharacterized protein n=1 Tax=Streblomastix strix TaxID=222440 RepID=A0A5J4TYI8_9EUKA|nr:MAG: hypothetical protein EZS28_041286 [Streblomastix strix]